MATKEAVAVKCTKCGETVEYPDFKCKKQPGNHSVPEKTYYHTGCSHIASMRDRQMFAPLIILRPGQDKLDPATQKIIADKGLHAQFGQRGLLTTADSEMQYYLDERGFSSGEEGLQAWRAVYLTPEQSRAIARDELSDLNRKIEEGKNTLLEQQKQARRNG